MSKIDTLFTSWKKEDHDMEIIRLLKIFIAILIGICLISFIGWMTSPSRMTLYIPPDISNGATIKPEQIPNPLIYSFAYDVWQELNYWPQDGQQDYENNLHTYWSYITPEFKSTLLQDEEDLKTTGQIQRERFLQGTVGAAYDPSFVKKLSDDTWEVDLHMRLTEFKNNQIVKDVEIIYPLKITRWNTSQQNNPYGLALAGFVSSPIRLKTFI